jgi:hypothetical protein
MKKNMFVIGTIKIAFIFLFNCVNIGYIHMTSEKTKDHINTTIDLLIMMYLHSIKLNIKRDELDDIYGL